MSGPTAPYAGHGHGDDRDGQDPRARPPFSGFPTLGDRLKVLFRVVRPDGQEHRELTPTEVSRLLWERFEIDYGERSIRDLRDDRQQNPKAAARDGIAAIFGVKSFYLTHPQVMTDEERRQTLRTYDSLRNLADEPDREVAAVHVALRNLHSSTEPAYAELLAALNTLRKFPSS